MPTFQHRELLPEHEILQYKIPTATEEANQCSDPEENDAEHGTELYQINDWKYCCKLLILRPARVLARDRLSQTLIFILINRQHQSLAALDKKSRAGFIALARVVNPGLELYKCLPELTVSLHSGLSLMHKI